MLSSVSKLPTSKTTGNFHPRPNPHITTSQVAESSYSSRPSSFMDDESDDEKPLVFRISATRATITKEVSQNGLLSASHNKTHESYDSDDSEDEKPLVSRLPVNLTPNQAILNDRCFSDDSEDDRPLILKRPPNGHVAPTLQNNSYQVNMVPSTNILASDGKFRDTSRDAGSHKLPSDEKKGPPDEKSRDACKVLESKKRPSDEKSGDASKDVKVKKRPLDEKSFKDVQTKKRPLDEKSRDASKDVEAKKQPPDKKSRDASKDVEAKKQPPDKKSRDPLIFFDSKKRPSDGKSKDASKDVDPKKPRLSSPVLPHLHVKKEDEDNVAAENAKSPRPSSNIPAMKLHVDNDEDEIPLAQRLTLGKEAKKPPVVKKVMTSLSTTVAAKKLMEAHKAKLKQKKIISKKIAKSQKNGPDVGDGQKWYTLEHSGVIFPPPYQSHGVKMLYNAKPVNLNPEQEEVATTFAIMRETDYVTKPKFLSNFWNDWRKLLGPNHVIQSLEGCDFTPIYDWHVAEKEKKKQMSAEEKKRLREEKLKQEEKYMWALVDGLKEKVGNFRVEPPGLFRGRGEHPKMGKLKRRIFPEDIVINIGADAPIPECPISGHRWKEIRHDNTVTWLAYWNDPINTKEFKYVFLAASSSLKGQSDKEKYEKARMLKDYIEDIRCTYTRNFTSKDSTERQIAVATYLIDRLALRAGNEKDDDEADTVGCCSLKVEHVTLVPPTSLQFDFLGKDSIRYFNTVEVVGPVYKAIGDFKAAKKTGHDLFDKLDTSKLNAHLKNIMPQLTAKVFRTYNASITLDKLLRDIDGDLAVEKIAFYQRANKEVAILCNHQRSVSKAHGAQIERLEGKIAELEGLLKELKTDLRRAKKGKPPLKDADGKPKRNQNLEALQKKVAQTEQRIEKMKLDIKMKDDLKTIALGTSKINYMDPRITVAWCKRHEVPIEKIFNKSLLAKFSWAMDVEMDYQF